MDIIKPGILPENRRYEAVCRNCGCHFSFLRHEAMSSENVKCPQEGCGKVTSYGPNSYARGGVVSGNREYIVGGPAIVPVDREHLVPITASVPLGGALSK